MRRRLGWIARHTGFALLLFYGAAIREGPGGSLDQAVIWLPTGIAVAGLLLLGVRSAWVIPLVTIANRVHLGYHPTVALPAAAGNLCEALLAVWVLRRLGAVAAFRHLGEFAAVIVAAVLAPFGSILFSYIGRVYVWVNPNMPFYSGWDGWWRMNALGVLTVVPVTLAWRRVTREEITARQSGLVAAAVAAAAAVIVLWFPRLPAGAVGIQWFDLVLLSATLYAAARFGSRGATLATACAALAVAAASSYGLGPFIALPRGERHVAIQLFELTLLTVPTAFGVLVTSRRDLEEQFRHAQKMEAVGRLAGGVAHDFNNLLTVILGYADTLRGEPRLEPSVRASADRVSEAATRAASLTQQLLAYSRQQVLQPRALEISQVVDRMGEMLRRLLGETVRLETAHGSRECWVRVDPSQLEQVVLNLAVNARDAMPRGGVLTLSTSFVDARPRLRGDRSPDGLPPHALLCVADTGTGMSPAVQARAFEPFFTTKQVGKGTGLGLATVYGIVQQSGGAVWLESAPGRGTSVFVALPRCAPSAQAAAVPPGAARARAAEILVVEDEPGVREFIARTLQRAGHRVREAANGAEAVTLLSEAATLPDLVVTDVVMPGLGGPELAFQLRQRHPALRVVFVTGYPERDGPHPLDPHRERMLAKPFTAEQLLARVDGCLAEEPVAR